MSALLTAESNRAAIDYIGAGRGSLHPALLLTAVVPEAFGPSGRMEDYWGPASFVWNSGTFLAQNMGQLYIGAIPLVLALLAALRGQLWEREVRFFTVAGVVALLYALGWYTPVFRVLYELVPGVGLFRRPADATFLIGALAAILAGYAAHRLFKDPPTPWEPRSVAIASVALAAAIASAIGLGFWLDRLGRLPLPLAAATLSFAGAAVALCRGQGAHARAAPARRRPHCRVHHRRPRLQQRAQRGDGACRPPPTTCWSPAPAMPPSPSSRRRSCATRCGATASSWPASASTGPTPASRTGWRTRWATTRCASASTAPPPAPGTTSACRTSAPSRPCFPPTAPSSPISWACASSSPACRSRRIDRTLKPGDLPLVARTSDGFIYENRDAMDRVLFATDAKGADFARMLADGDVARGRLALHRPASKAQPPATAPRRPGRVRIVSYRNDEVVLDADSPDGGWVVLNDLWHPWWFADIDGRPADMLRANVLFRAVAVPAGRHTVRFTFRPIAGAWRQILGRARAGPATLRAHLTFMPASDPP